MHEFSLPIRLNNENWGILTRFLILLQVHEIFDPSFEKTEQIGQSK